MMKTRPRLLLLAAAMLSVAACDGGIDSLRELVNSNVIYVPSSAMEPTLPTNSRMTAIRIEQGDVERGGIYIVQTSLDDARVFRLIGLPGDTVLVEDGEVTLNGKKLRLEAEGEHSFETQYEGPKTAARFREYLPGDRRGHSVLDLGTFPLDDTASFELGPDQYFFLGDNRDNAADSRAEPNEFGTGGVGIVTSDQITHRIEMESVVG